MDKDIDALRAEVAALRAELADQRTSPPRADRAMSRRRLLTGLAGLGAASAVANADPAGAAAGDPAVLGETNVSTTTTRLDNTDTPVNPVPGFPIDAGEPLLLLQDSGQESALIALSGDTAIWAAGSIEGLVVWGGGHAIRAESDGIVAVAALAHGDATGAAVDSDTGTGVWVHTNSGAHVHLVPNAAVGPPAGIPAADVGMISLDAGGDLWVCVAGGDPGTWTRLLREDSAEGRTVPITPIRALDTRAPGGRANGAPSIPGQTHGPLHGGQTVTLDPAGTGPIPATATGIIGNAIVLAPTTNGYLRIIPAGTGATTSAVSFTKATTTSNAYTTALSPTGLTATAPITPTATYHLVLDITAYIT